MQVKVSRLGLLDEHVPVFDPTHVVSLLDPALPEGRVPSFGERELLQLFFFDDDDLDKQVEPLEVPIVRVLEFLRERADSPEGVRLLLHCHAGASRSPAAAYVLFYIQLGDAELAFSRLLEITNKPWPSRKFVAIADQVLGGQGLLLAPLDRYRGRYPYRYAAYMRLNRARGI